MTYLRSSKSFCQLGKVVLSQSKPREMTGSPKKPRPTPKVTPFMNILEVTKSEIPKTGRMRVAIRRR